MTHIDAQTAFLDHLARRELRLARSRRDGRILDVSELRQADPDDLDWIEASGRGRLFSFVIYRRPYHPDFPPPYNVAAVALQEGPLLISTVLTEPERLVIDMPLQAAFAPDGRLVFQPLVTP